MQDGSITKHDANPDNSLSDKVAIVKEQINAVATLMRDTMKEGEHYGKIPGTKKPTLLKSGAEKLSTLFSLSPEYKIDIKYFPDGLHREYIVTCRLHHRKSGEFCGEGLGSASTMESKWRYRNDYERTGKVVPSAYWDNEKNPEYIGGAGFFAKKEDDGRWIIYKTNGKIENPDIADTYNTVLKIAKKRAHVDAVLTATSASDIFTQDIEDLPDFNKQCPKSEKDVTPQEEKKQPKKEKTSEEKYSELPDEVRDLFDAVANSKDLNPRFKICEHLKWEPVAIIEWLNNRQNETSNQDSELNKLPPSILSKFDLVKDLVGNPSKFCMELKWDHNAINKKLDEYLIQKNKQVSSENKKFKGKNVEDADFAESINSMKDDDIFGADSDSRSNQEIP